MPQLQEETSQVQRAAAGLLAVSEAGAGVRLCHYAGRRAPIAPRAVGIGGPALLPQIS